MNKSIFYIYIYIYNKIRTRYTCISRNFVGFTQIKGKVHRACTANIYEKFAGK